MRAQIVENVIPIFVAHVQSLLHHDNIRVTYAKTLNFKIEPLTSMPLYFVAMPQSIILVIEAPFVLMPINIAIGIRSRPQTRKGT